MPAKTKKNGSRLLDEAVSIMPSDNRSRVNTSELIELALAVAEGKVPMSAARKVLTARGMKGSADNTIGTRVWTAIKRGDLKLVRS